jgi:hypothetical protein
MLQDGMLYLFNLPGSQPGTAAAAAAGSSSVQQPAAAAAAGTAVGASPPGSELMVQGLPDWEPLSSQIFRQYVEAVLSTLEKQQQQWRQQQPMEVDIAPPAAAGSEQQEQGDLRTPEEVIAAVKRALDMRADARGKGLDPDAAIGLDSSRQQQQQQRGQPQQLWMAGEMTAAMRDAPGSVAQADAAIAAAERLLGFAVQRLAGSCSAAAELKPRFQFGSRQQQHSMCSWEERARHVAQLLQVRLELARLQMITILWQCLLHCWLTAAVHGILGFSCSTAASSKCVSSMCVDCLPGTN